MSNVKCAQIYIHGDDQEKLRQKYSSTLNAIILIQLQAMLLDECDNSFVKQFKKASQILKKRPSVELKIVIITSKEADRRVYNKPTNDEIAVIIPNFGESTGPTQREAIVFEKNGNLKTIGPNKACYDPMQYPLIFPTGQLGWEYNTLLLNIQPDKELEEESNDLLKEIIHQQEESVTIQEITGEKDVVSLQELSDEQEDAAILQQQDQGLNEDQDYSDENTPENDDTSTKINKKMKFVTAMQYYAYQLCDRPGSYLHLYGRLFHQYIVGAITEIMHQ